MGTGGLNTREPHRTTSSSRVVGRGTLELRRSLETGQDFLRHVMRIVLKSALAVRKGEAGFLGPERENVSRTKPSKEHRISKLW